MRPLPVVLENLTLSVVDQFEDRPNKRTQD
jgi:hypothetical protein